MADIRIPEEIEKWMSSLNWGIHHVEYHMVKRWDIWQYRAALGNPQAIEVMEYMKKNQWERAKIQEGATGDGIEFLAMHRAMLLLLLEKFPQHRDIFKGWNSPPTDPADPHDPVTGGTPFNKGKEEAIKIIESDPDHFSSEDHFGIFIETNIQPLPENPDNRVPDERYGIHNYLHGRWTDPESPINLGDPEVNILNRRFWDLHGWIDTAWSTYRQRTGKNDNDPTYKKTIEYYKHMMSGHHHHHMKARRENLNRPEILKRFFD